MCNPKFPVFFKSTKYPQKATEKKICTYRNSYNIIYYLFIIIMWDDERLRMSVGLGIIFVFLFVLGIMFPALLILSLIMALIVSILCYYAILSAYDHERDIKLLEKKVEYMKQTLYDEIRLLKEDKN